MTARSVSWTDTRRVAALLAQVSGAKRPPPAPAVRSMGAPPRVDAPRPPAPAPAAPPPPAAPPRLEHGSDNPVDRLDALIAWTLAHHRCVGAFVADDNGLTLAAHGISEAHVSIVGPLLSALSSVRTVPGVDATAGALWMGAHMMSWVEARSERGGFCLGVIGDEALSVRALEQLKDALAATVRGL